MKYKNKRRFIMNELSKSLLPSSCKPDDTNLVNFKQHIVDFFNWLNNVQQKSIVNLARKEKNEILFLLLQLKKQLSHSISALNMPYVAERQEFFCEICSGEIILEPLQDIWECLENHCHLKSSTTVEIAQNTSQTKEELPNNIQSNCYSDECLPEETRVNKKLNFKEKLVCNVGSENDFESSIHSIGRNGSKDEFESDVAVEKSIITEKLSSNSSILSTKVKNEDLPIVKSRLWYPVDFFIKFEESKGKLEVGLPVSNCKDFGEKKFRFSFKSKYSPNLETFLYPKLYHKFDIDGDPILQKTGPERTVCLTCCCELLNQKNPGNIMSHMSGTRHVQITDNPKTSLIIKNYHDTFLRLDRKYQSHQIYFATDEECSLLKCVVCMKYVKSCDVMAHILDGFHISKLINLSIEVKMHSLFYFLESHVEEYEVKQLGLNKINALDQNEKAKGINGKQHNIAKSIDKLAPASKMNLPGRFSQHLKFLQTKGDLIFCTICEKDKRIFRQEDTHLHLVQPHHLMKSKIQMSNYMYHCEVCDKRCHDEITWIIHFEEDKKRHLEAVESTINDKPLEYECSTCKIVLFGDSEAVEKHKQSNLPRRNEKTKATVLNKEVKQYFATKALIRENGEKLLIDAERVISNNDIVLSCLADLENSLKSKYSLCKAYPFGSRISGLGASHSDLDVFVDIGYMYNGNQNQHEDDQTKIITNVMNLIKKKKEFYQINCRPTARTPIIQLKHRPTALECDISFVHGLSVENTKFIRYCFEMQPIAQMLVLLVKKWSHLCGLSENITTYALAMLGIFYLQKNNYLPSVQKLKDSNKINMTIVGWETINYITPKEEIMKNFDTFDGDIIDLLIGFFKFYSDFNYKLNVVCPLLGTEISKGLFSIDPKGGALPKEMATYFMKVNTEKYPEYFRCLSSFCIQDPFDLSHNLTKACSHLFLDKFVKLCTLTHAMLGKLTD